MDKGVLYGVGVGPGDPQLMTLKAVETIRRCPVVAAPRTKSGAMVALDIARGAVDLTGKVILPLDFAMSRDADERQASHQAAAGLVASRLDAGESVAMLNLGDVSIYASYRYIADILRARGYDVKMVPGVPSFCAAAAALGINLTDMDKELRIVPDDDGEAENLGESGTTIYMKSGKNLSALLGRIAAANLRGNTSLVQNCGMANERVYHTLTDAPVESDYFSLVIVRNGIGEDAS